MSEELMYNQLYERTKDFGRTQFIKELMNLERQNKESQQRIDEAGQYLEYYLIGNYAIAKDCQKPLAYLLSILQGKDVK